VGQLVEADVLEGGGLVPVLVGLVLDVAEHELGAAGEDPAVLLVDPASVRAREPLLGLRSMMASGRERSEKVFLSRSAE
jgi:hypothetical protein